MPKRCRSDTCRHAPAAAAKKRARAVAPGLDLPDEIIRNITDAAIQFVDDNTLRPVCKHFRRLELLNDIAFYENSKRAYLEESREPWFDRDRWPDLESKFARWDRCIELLREKLFNMTCEL